ncbi:MAG TPA: protein kinase [Candidatus Acidoferrum sp.]|nr:protein kinase [Candidatus Acidoferrum sp.]
MDTIKLCPKCASPLPPDAPAGICPKCLLNAGFESQSGAAANPMTGFVPPEPAELAKHFPQLEILEMLGAGGMGVVYKARQVALDRIVAVKILPPSAGSDPAFAERFSREARALAKLSHPNIVGVYDFGQAGPYYYFLMEFVDGVNLRQMLTAERIAPREALAIVPQICDALQYAHDLGIVHRDIKPENLLIDRRGRVRIADFGLARLLGPITDPRLTQSQHVMGTPHYMAPEQFEKPLAVDHRADIYSLGVVLYEMLTGELPLGRFDLPSHKVQIDVRLDDIVLKTLAKEPERRYQHASEVKTEMETLAGIPLSQLPPGLRNVFGVEYKSKTSLFGLPLLHVSMGYEPITGKQRHARGIIAIGGKATGIIAAGGVAHGIVAFGGVAVGVIAIGGVGVGVVTMGGVALALLLAWGGLAISTGIAFGGLAIGYYACGGFALGNHAMGSNGADKIAVQFFKPWFKPWVNVVGLFVILLPMAVQALVVWWARSQQNSRMPTRSIPVPPRFSRAAIVGALLAVCFPIALLAFFSVTYARLSAPSRGEASFTKTSNQLHPVALWRGEGDTTDESKQFNGVLQGDVRFVPGARGQAFQLNGTDAWIRVPDSPALHFSNAVSVSMWFKRDDQESFGGLIDKHDPGSVCNFGVHMSPEWNFHVYFCEGTNAPFGRRNGVRLPGRFQNSFSPLPEPGVFHHLVATWAQTTPENVTMQTYLDGKLVKSGVFEGNLKRSVNHAPISIGTAREGKAGSIDMFRGLIDEVALYDRVLTQEEVLDQLNAINDSPSRELVSNAVFAKILIIAIGVLGLFAPFATTICGIMAIGEIRRSRGCIYGMPLAVVDALLFPIVFLNALLAAGAIFMARLIDSPAARPFGAILGVLIGIAVSVLLIVLTWRAVKRPVEPGA